jgi:hypothetical protein
MLRWTTLSATAMLAVAALTGVLLRFGLFMGMPDWAQNFSAVRHAHSHLMYFGWVTLGLMVLIWFYLPQLTHRPLPRGVGPQMAVTAVLAALSFPAFWSNGYGLTQVGDLKLPLGSMVAGLNVIGWIGFAVLYVRATRGLADRPLAVQLWDWALVLMAVASAGAFGIAAGVATGGQSVLLQQFFLHLFLDLFATGWFGLALLGVIWAQPALRSSAPANLPTFTLALALAPTFILGMNPAAVTPLLFWVAAIANAAAAVLLLRHLLALWQRRGVVPLLLQFGGVALALHLVSAALVLIPGVWTWSAGTQLRVYVLHLFLLGWVSSGLLAGLLQAAEAQGWYLPAVRRVVEITWIVGVAVMVTALAGLGLVALVPIPVPLWFQVAAWSSILPATAATLLALAFLSGWSERVQPSPTPGPARPAATR